MVRIPDKLKIIAPFLHILIPERATINEFRKGQSTTPSKFPKMATSIQKNLEEKNKEYAAQFTQGDLVLPPAKKYAVRKYFVPNKASLFLC
jgi:hypothetical protein